VSVVLGVRDSPEHRAAYLIRAEALARIATAQAEARIPTLLVKGAGLALTVYDKPWQRAMSDIDLLVAEDDRDASVAALQAAGLEPERRRNGRWLTEAPTDERLLAYRAAGVSWLVEVHSRLDPIFGRPVDYPAIIRRAQPLVEFPGLSVPSPEDHVLLVILHAASSEFLHEPCWLDLALLLRGEIDEHAIVLRAKQWRMGTAAFIALTTLASMDDAPPLASVLADRLQPSTPRLLALRPWYELGRYPLHDRPGEVGLPWVLRQTLLRDDLSGWLANVGRYAALRAVERAGAPLRRSDGGE
jgi:hypothetical protein